MHSYSKKIRKISETALLMALMIIFSILENLIPPLPFMIPGAKIGIANIVIMYSVVSKERGQAFFLVISKALFALFRGLTAAFLSLCGGVLSLLIVYLLILFFKEDVSYMMLCVCSAVFHNLGQFFAISILFGSFVMLPYLLPLIIFGLLAGIGGAFMLKFTMPYLKRIKVRGDST